jgi:hypothetical protein
VEAFAAAWAGGDSASANASEASSWSYLAGASARPFPWLMAIGRYEAGWMEGKPAERKLIATLRAALQQNVAVTADFIVEMPHADSTETVGSVFVAF